MSAGEDIAGRTAAVRIAGIKRRMDAAAEEIKKTHYQSYKT